MAGAEDQLEFEKREREYQKVRLMEKIGSTIDDHCREFPMEWGEILEALHSVKLIVEGHAGILQKRFERIIQNRSPRDLKRAIWREHGIARREKQGGGN